MPPRVVRDASVKSGPPPAMSNPTSRGAPEAAMRTWLRMSPSKLIARS